MPIETNPAQQADSPETRLQKVELQVKTTIVVKYIAFTLNAFTEIGGNASTRALLCRLIRDHHHLAFTALPRQPFLLEPEKVVVIFIRHADDDDTVFDELHDIQVFRRSWNLFFVNMTRGLNVQVTGRKGNVSNLRWTNPTIGHVSARKFTFTSVEDHLLPNENE